MQAVFNNIKDTFCSMWSFKERGNTLEVITPYATTNLKFISVFITKQNGFFIITDGGYLEDSEYDLVPDIEDGLFMRVFHHYEDFYEIKSLEHQNRKIYFKKTKKEELIPNLVYDLANFTSAIINTSQIQFISKEEKEAKESFRKKADNYLAGILNSEELSFRRMLGNDYKSVRFNAVISRGRNINLVKYITGSSVNYFQNSITKATVDFEIANSSPYNEYIDNRIALLNDTAEGFITDKLFRYVQVLEKHTKIDSVRWSEKGKIKSILN